MSVCDRTTYDPSRISYKLLVEYFYRRVDPTDSKGQFCDKGKQYQSAIYYVDENQQKIVKEITNKLKKSFKQKRENSLYANITEYTFL